MKIFLVAAALVLASQGFAQDAVIKAASGKVEIVPAGSKKAVKAKAKDTLLFGDTVRTKKGGLAQIETSEGAVVLLKGETTMTLTGEPQNPVVDVAIGEFLIGLAKKLAKGSSFRARVPAAVAAVRGTLFWGKTGEDKKATFAAVGHSIAVTAKNKIVVLKPNQASTIEFGSAPGEPADAGVTRDFLKSFAIDGGIQGMDALADKSIK